jgi:hypothetical protein
VAEPGLQGVGVGIKRLLISVCMRIRKAIQHGLRMKAMKAKIVKMSFLICVYDLLCNIFSGRKL